ncbi:mannosyl-oligosaccharide glucosidase [Marchantia polymorpha subsp. ruderalis]|uniref:Mannosyl-oligosaccharide glucosidase n=2 Tax=Marchantia polymorpha TaxID=3197 RepID=A0AAF6BIK4_MARPO|nr:hypothetical protein MARPO_0071s0095 [Marchantia polymorpha]BBN11838.1 hypothetical protein Mp_5g15150 [Marchantia polymorpha subsp. ruderalis]|eukprot:PTQ35484.1 hypothetical protein MARPO_0071s0095 [Marchantia polymorpha]
MKERRRASTDASSSSADLKSSGKNNAKRPPKSKRGGIVRKVCPGSTALLLGICVVALGVAALYWIGALSPAMEEPVRPRAVTPLPVPRVSDLKQFKGEYRERMFWGTYRPQNYLGIRSRTPQSLLAGLMWLGVKDGRYAIRHTCEESDKLARYGWLRHDGSTYGRQELLDQGVTLTTSFLKSWEDGSGYGGDWAVRIKVEAENATESSQEDGQPKSRSTSIFFYIAEEAGRSLSFWPKGKNVADAPFVGGSASEIGGWQFHLHHKEDVAVSYAGLRQIHMHNLTQLVLNTLMNQGRLTGRLQLPDSSDRHSNIAVLQISGSLPFEVDMVFLSGVDKKGADVPKRLKNLTGVELERRLIQKEQEFENRFQDTFKLNEKVGGEKEVEVGRAALSNMVGGIGYFHGQSRIAIPAEFKGQEPELSSPDYWLYWPAELFTAVPSRSFFPRGFLWDEGFHQLLISRWDRNISLDIIAHWLDLMNVDGWIPREQILGAEARSKVPEEFVIQHTSNANPPALMLVIRRLALSLELDLKQGQAREEDMEYFKTMYPRLQAWFNWFNTTQSGKQPGTYYWHGRDSHTSRELNPKTLTSGLDDYPRASHPTDDERHVDLWCWMAHAAETMSLIARLTGEPHESYEATANGLTNLTRLNEMHYDLESGHYYDYGLHTEEVKLRWKELKDPRIKTGIPQRILRRVVLKKPKLGWVPHFGYVSFFPFALRIIPADSTIMGHHLALLHSHDLLWTEFGLRSLATTSSVFMKHNTEHDAPYWRGPVWMNMNYLILSALYKYSQEEGHYKKTAALLYPQLRDNLIRNVVKQYHESGYLWENYDLKSKGKGQGSHPFSGWTSLILLIMGEMY